MMWARTRMSANEYHLAANRFEDRERGLGHKFSTWVAAKGQSPGQRPLGTF